jgi:hypothetical protein
MPALRQGDKLSLLVKDDFVLITASNQTRWRKVSKGDRKWLQA